MAETTTAATGTPKRKPFYLSHKVWGATLAAAVVLVEHYGLGGSMPIDKLLLVIAPFIALLLGEQAADLLKVYREWKARLEPMTTLLPKFKTTTTTGATDLGEKAEPAEGQGADE